MLIHSIYIFVLFFFNDTATTEIYTLSLHDALPIYLGGKCVARLRPVQRHDQSVSTLIVTLNRPEDRKSTRLNSSHPSISYAVFCLKKKKKKKQYYDYIYTTKRQILDIDRQKQIMHF